MASSEYTARQHTASRAASGHGCLHGAAQLHRAPGASSRSCGGGRAGALARLPPKRPLTARLAPLGTGSGCSAATRRHQGGAAPTGSQWSTAAHSAAQSPAGERRQRAGGSDGSGARAAGASKCGRPAAFQRSKLPWLTPPHPAQPHPAPPRPTPSHPPPPTGYQSCGQSTSWHASPFMLGNCSIASFHSWGAISRLTVSKGTPAATELTCTRRVQVAARGKEQGMAAAAADERAAQGDRAQDLRQEPDAAGAPPHNTWQCLAGLNRPPASAHPPCLATRPGPRSTWDQAASLASPAPSPPHSPAACTASVQPVRQGRAGQLMLAGRQAGASSKPLVQHQAEHDWPSPGGDGFTTPLKLAACLAHLMVRSACSTAIHVAGPEGCAFCQYMTPQFTSPAAAQKKRGSGGHTASMRPASSQELWKGRLCWTPNIQLQSGLSFCFSSRARGASTRPQLISTRSAAAHRLAAVHPPQPRRGPPTHRVHRGHPAGTVRCSWPAGGT